MIIMLWLVLPLLLAALISTYVVQRQKRVALDSVMHSNYKDAQRRRLERLATYKYHPPVDGSSVRTLTSVGQQPNGRHRRM